jgi:HAD superfamily hydrolase (TIGR01509 family)
MKALIFDFDGLIVDTETPIFEAWRACYEEHDEALSLEEYVACVGSDFGGYDPGEELERRCGRELDWDRLLADRRERVDGALKGAEALPGVRELLAEAQAEGVACAVASSSSVEWVGGWLDRLGLATHFSCLRCRDHVERVKPDPELFLAASEGVSVEVGEALVLEDSVNGMRAAHAAGMRCVAVPGPVTRGMNFEGAALRLESLAGVGLEMLRRAF